MDSGTATHPPCPMCDPSILPEGYSPMPGEPDLIKGVPPKRSVMLRPDGSYAYMKGAVKVYLNGQDVTNQAKDVDVERSVVVSFHRVMAPGPDGPQMVRHICNREDREPGDPRNDPGPEGHGHACMSIATGEVVVIDKATGKPPVFLEPLIDEGLPPGYDVGL